MQPLYPLTDGAKKNYYLPAMKKLLPPIVLLLAASIAFAQSAELTNDNVIEMVKAGISESVILTKIKNSPTKFDTSVSGLAALSAAKVPDSIINLMIAGNTERPPDPAPAQPAAIEKPVRPPSPPFTAYSSLAKSEQKQRLKGPAMVGIAAPADGVSSLLVQAFQIWNYQVESESNRSLVLSKPVSGFGDELLVGMALGGNNHRYKVQVSIGEYGGISNVSVSAWVTADNVFGKTTQQSLNGSKKWRAQLDMLLAAVKQRAEIAQ